MIESPCIGICTLITEKCIGCFRTAYEIENWLHFTDKERKEITKKCLIKMKNINKI